MRTAWSYTDFFSSIPGSIRLSSSLCAALGQTIEVLLSRFKHWKMAKVKSKRAIWCGALYRNIEFGFSSLYMMRGKGHPVTQKFATNSRLVPKLVKALMSAVSWLWTLTEASVLRQNSFNASYSITGEMIHACAILGDVQKYHSCG